MNERRCKAQNRRGERCLQTKVNAAGYCVAHDPEGSFDPRAMGRLSGKARGPRAIGRLAAGDREGVRAELRKIDPRGVREAIEEALAGDNATAKMRAVSLLADLEVYKDDGCEACEQRALIEEEHLHTLEQARESIAELEEIGVLVRRYRVEELAQERLAVLKAEHGIKP